MGHLDLYTRKSDMGLLSYNILRNQCQVNYRIKCEMKNTEFLEDKVEESLFDLEVGKSIFNKTQEH